jgi:hypothetical protein
MFEIDYLKLFTDQKIYDALFAAFKKNTSLSDVEIEEHLKKSINKHGDNMNIFLKEHINTYQKMKNDNLTNKEIDRKLDEMVNNIKSKSKSFNKE